MIRKKRHSFARPSKLQQRNSTLPRKALQPSFNREKGSLPADFQAYLAKGGTFFGSVRGMRYIAANSIKSASDYQKYFSLEKLFQTRNFLKDFSVFPPLESDHEIFVRSSSPFGVVDGDYVSLWIVPDEIARSDSGSTYRGYRLLGSK